MSSTTSVVNLSRRKFLQVGGGLTLGLILPALQNKGMADTASPGIVSNFEPNPFLSIAPDSSITLFSKHLEMGQGAYTGLATLLAEELDASWDQITVVGAPADAKRFNNLAFGTIQGTGGSTAMSNSWIQMRTAGASARKMLVAQAAKHWNVSAQEISVNNGIVSHAASGQSASFGELVGAAGSMAVPEKVVLKDPKDFKLIGHTFKRKDSRDKINGSAQFTQDVQLPGMLIAVVAHPPLFGSIVKSFDASAAKKVANVVDVVQIPEGVAVLAKDTWSAKKGRDALIVQWDDSAAFKLSSSEIMASYRETAKRPGLTAAKHGDVTAASKNAVKTLQSEFEFPYLAHAAMEPMNCVIQRTKDGCHVWNGEQFHTVDQMALSAIFDLTPDQIKITTLFAGGSFGRRASTTSDYVKEAAHIVKAIDNDTPVKLVWLREDDMRAGYYRPMFFQSLQASLNEKGDITAWQHRLVGQSIATDTPMSMLVKDGIDHLSVEGAANLPYAIPNLTVELHTPTDIGVPVLWWRSVGSTHTAYSTEVFIDQIASETGKDPVALRLSLLKKHPRHTAVLEAVAEKAEWTAPLAAGKKGERRGRGVAVHESFGSVVAQIAEVSIAANGAVRVDRIVCAVDCGTAINPDNIHAQVQGSVAFALSAFLQGEITLDKGKVTQGNFDTYTPLRMNQMPKVEVHILASAEPPSGIGEPGVPPVAPSVANAIAAATGQYLTSLPIKTASLAV